MCALCKFSMCTECVWAVCLFMIHGSEHLFLWQPSIIHKGLLHTLMHMHTYLSLAHAFGPVRSKAPRSHCWRRSSVTQAQTHTRSELLSCASTFPQRVCRHPFFCHSRCYMSQYCGSISLTLWASICRGLSGPRGAPCFGQWQRGRDNQHC